MATLRTRVGVVAICAGVTLSMAACTGSGGRSTSAPAAVSSSPSASPAASPSPSAPGPVTATTTPAGPGGPSAGPSAGPGPTKGPIDPENPQDPRVGLTLTGTVHTAG